MCRNISLPLADINRKDYEKCLYYYSLLLPSYLSITLDSLFRSYDMRSYKSYPVMKVFTMKIQLQIFIYIHLKRAYLKMKERRDICRYKNTQ